MKNTLPSEEFIMSLNKGDEITLLGQKMTANFRITSRGIRHWYMERPKSKEEKELTLDGWEYGWVHVREGNPEVDIGIAAMPKNRLAEVIASGNFFIG